MADEKIWIKAEKIPGGKLVMVSIIIPAHREPYLQKTIDSLLKGAVGEVEILAILDGWDPEKPIKPDKRVRIVKLNKHLGMRAAINAGIMKSKGEFLMKSDAHCAFGIGFDKILRENCAKDWLIIPRRYSLNETKWQRDKTRPYRDYHYLTYPTPNGIYGITISNPEWNARTRQSKNSKYDIDDTMTFQGSCWMANKKYFLKKVGFLDDREEAYSPFGGEPMEIGLKYWLGGGQVKVIKKAWYAHLAKRGSHYQAGLFTKRYKLNQARSRTWAAKHWMDNAEPDMIHPFSWLIEKFWPVPTWPEDRSLWVFPS